MRVSSKRPSNTASPASSTASTAPPPTKETILSTGASKSSVVSSLYFKERQRESEESAKKANQNPHGQLSDLETLTISLQSAFARQCVLVCRTRKPNTKDDDDDIFERLFFYYPSGLIGEEDILQDTPSTSTTTPTTHISTAEKFAISNVASKVEGWLNLLDTTIKAAESHYDAVFQDPNAQAEYRNRHQNYQQNVAVFHNHCIVVDSTHDARIAVCKRDRLIFALCCKRIVPRKIMRDHILKLANVYELYNGPVADIYHGKCGADEVRFEAYVRSTAPELRTIASQLMLHPNRAFSPLQYTEVPPRSHTLFVGASQLLDSCTQCVDYFGGCIMCDQSILCNQLDSELLQWVLHRNRTMRDAHFVSPADDQYSGDSHRDEYAHNDEELADDLRQGIFIERNHDFENDTHIVNPPSPTDSINSAHNVEDGEAVGDDIVDDAHKTSLFHLDDDDDDEADFATYDDSAHDHQFNNDDPLIEEEHPDDDVYTQRLFTRKKRHEENANSRTFTPVTVERLREYLSHSSLTGAGGSSEGVTTTSSSGAQADPNASTTQQTNASSSTNTPLYHHREHILLSPHGNKLDLSHIFLTSQMLRELYHNTHSYYDLKRAFSAQRINHANNDNNAAGGVYMVLVIIQSERLSITAIYRKDFVLSEEFITKVLEPVTEELNILESKLEQLKDILENVHVLINDHTIILKPSVTNTSTTPSANDAFSSTSNRSTLLFDRFNHKMRGSLQIRQYDSFMRSIVPIRESLLKDHASKVILKKSDELVFGKVMFNSEIYEQFKLDGGKGADLPLEKAEGLVRKHVREDFKINLI